MGEPQEGGVTRNANIRVGMPPCGEKSEFCVVDPICQAAC